MRISKRWRRAPLLIAVLVVAATTVFYVRRGREMARRTISVANLAAIAKVVAEYGDAPSLAGPEYLCHLAEIGAIKAETLVSPNERLHDAKCSYVILNRKGVGDDQSCVIGYEDPRNYDRRGTVVLYADTHAEFVGGEVLKQLEQADLMKP